LTVKPLYLRLGESFQRVKRTECELLQVVKEEKEELRKGLKKHSLERTRRDRVVSQKLKPETEQIIVHNLNCNSKVRKGILPLVWFGN
jgi:hypothetical protein